MFSASNFGLFLRVFICQGNLLTLPSLHLLRGKDVRINTIWSGLYSGFVENLIHQIKASTVWKPCTRERLGLD